MLDLVFLIMLIYIILRSLWGYYKETLCNVALVIGILAGVAGFFIICFKTGYSGNTRDMALHIAVIGIALAQKHAAKYFANSYNNKIKESREKLEKELEMHSRRKKGEYSMDENDFDNEEIRFGKGGYTNND